MKDSERRKIDELARRAIEKSVASVAESEGILFPSYRKVSSATTAATAKDIRRYISPFPFVAAILASCLVILPLTVKQGTQLSHISAVVHRRGEFERCFKAAHDIVMLASESQYNQTWR